MGHSNERDHARDNDYKRVKQRHPMPFAPTTPSRMDGRYIIVLLVVIHQVALATPPPGPQSTDTAANSEYLSTDKRPNVSDLYRLLRTLRSDRTMTNLPTNIGTRTGFGKSLWSKGIPARSLRWYSPAETAFKGPDDISSYKGPHDFILTY